MIYLSILYWTFAMLYYAVMAYLYWTCIIRAHRLGIKIRLKGIIKLAVFCAFWPSTLLFFWIKTKKG